MLLSSFETYGYDRKTKMYGPLHHEEQFLRLWPRSPKFRKYAFNYLWTGFPKESQKYQKFYPGMMHASGAYYILYTDHPDINKAVYRVHPACRFIKWEEDNQLVWYNKEAKRRSMSQLKVGDTIWGAHKRKKIPVTVTEIVKKYRLSGFLLHYYVFFGRDYMGENCLPPYLANGLFVAPSNMLSYTSRKMPNKVTETIYDPQGNIGQLIRYRLPKDIRERM